MKKIVIIAAVIVCVIAMFSAFMEHEEKKATADREHWVKSDVPFIYMNRKIK